MFTETVFEYKHKKFDHRKRSRDEDSSSTKSEFDDLSLEYPSLESIWKNPSPKRRKINIVHPQPVFVSAPQHIYHSNVIFTNDNRICIQSEPIDFSVRNQTSSANRIEPIIADIKTEILSIHKMKQELFALSNESSVPIIAKETLEDICKYKSNMARKFPKKERSPKELERRLKNTVACRKSRRIEKLQKVATEEVYRSYKKTNFRVEECAIRAAAYLKELNKLTEKSTSDGR